MADLQLIKPRELVPATEVFSDAALIVDGGVDVNKCTPLQVVNAGAPVASDAEAIAGIDNTKRMTAHTVRVVLDDVTAPAVSRAQAWAESPTAPDPAMPSSKSSKTWAGEASDSALAAEGARLAAEASSADAALSAAAAAQSAQECVDLAASLENPLSALENLADLTDKATARANLEVPAISAALLRANNLSDLTDRPAARANLGVPLITSGQFIDTAYAPSAELVPLGIAREYGYLGSSKALGSNQNYNHLIEPGTYNVNASGASNNPFPEMALIAVSRRVASSTEQQVWQHVTTVNGNQAVRIRVSTRPTESDPWTHTWTAWKEVGGIDTVAYVYTGTTSTNTAFPIGSTVLVTTTTAVSARNSTIAVYLNTANEWQFTTGSGTQLAGTWRVRGWYSGSGTPNICLAERVA